MTSHASLGGQERSNFEHLLSKVLISDMVRDGAKQMKIWVNKGLDMQRAPFFENFKNFAKFATFSVLPFFRKQVHTSETVKLRPRKHNWDKRLSTVPAGSS